MQWYDDVGRNFEPLLTISIFPDSCTVNNGDCGSYATCSHEAITNAAICTCKAGYTNTGTPLNVVCN
ncbi:unnamed protein product, partial [Rotaria magnacalcarata]